VRRFALSNPAVEHLLAPCVLPNYSCVKTNATYYTLVFDTGAALPTGIQGCGAVVLRPACAVHLPVFASCGIEPDRDMVPRNFTSSRRFLRLLQAFQAFCYTHKDKQKERFQVCKEKGSRPNASPRHGCMCLYIYRKKNATPRSQAISNFTKFIQNNINIYSTK
jgi:hypothetical protein